MLAKLAAPMEHSDWVEKLGREEFPINDTVQRVTGCSPSEMLSGVEQRGEVIDEFTEQLLEDYIEEGEENLALIRQHAISNIERAQGDN